MNGTLAFTISPPDRVTRYNHIRAIYLDDKRFLNNKLRQCCSKYILYPELDIKGRLHYHGMICINDPIKWRKSVYDTIRYNLGYCHVKKLNNFKEILRWLMYCQKEYAITWQVLEEREPIIPKKPRKIKFRDHPELDGGILEYLDAAVV